MKIKYVAKRNEICAGALTLLSPLKDENLNYDSHCEYIFYPSNMKCLRSLFFKENENKEAEDIIFSSPENYIIFNLMQKVYDKPLIITHKVQLDDYLKFLEFPTDLTQEHINKLIRLLNLSKRFITDQLYFQGGISLETFYNIRYLSTLPLKPQPTEPNYTLIKKNNRRLFKIL